MMERRFYQFGPFRLDANCGVLFRGSAQVPLPPKVAETLAVLGQNAGRVVSKEELLRRVWPITFIEEGSLTQTISILRKALHDGNGQEFIATLSKRGYRFTVTVNETAGLCKFQGDIGVLQRAAADLVKPFREVPGFETFARWFRSARHRVRVLRLVFPNDSRSTAALVRLRLENLDSGILDREFPETAIRVSDITDSSELMSATHVLRQVDELVAEARAFPVRNRKQTFA